MSYVHKKLDVPTDFTVAICDGCKLQRHSDKQMVKEARGDCYMGLFELTGGRNEDERDEQDRQPRDGWSAVRKQVVAQEDSMNTTIRKGQKYVTTLHFCAACAGRIG